MKAVSKNGVRNQVDEFLAAAGATLSERTRGKMEVIAKLAGQSEWELFCEILSVGLRKIVGQSISRKATR